MDRSQEMREWYRAEDETTVHEYVFPYVEAVQADQCDLHDANVAYARLYSNREEPGLTPGVRMSWRPGWTSVTENLVKSTVDTAGSLIGKSHPRVRVLTDGAPWSFQLLAKKLEKYLDGMFEALNVYSKTFMMFRDACIWGMGVLRIEEEDGEVSIRRVLIDNIVVDENEVTATGQPLHLHEVHLVSKTVLKEKYPDHEEAIDNATEGRLHAGEYTNVEPGMAVLVESWRLPCGDEPGKYSVCIKDATLHCEEYDLDHYPHVFYSWSPPLTGFYGQGLAEELLGFQIRINELNDFIRTCQDLVAVPRILAEHGANMLPVYTNEIGQVMPYTGAKPEFFTPPAVSPEIYQERERIRSAALEMAGISRMAAHAARPEGVEHAVGMRELSDNQSQRLSNSQQRYENVHIEIGRRILRVAREIYESSDGAPTAFMSEDFVDSIEWDKVDVDAESFKFNVQASSILGESPSGRLQRVLEMQQYGVPLTPAETRRLLALPDLELSDARANSQHEHAEWVIEKLSKGEWPPPHAFMDLPLTVDLVTAAMLEAERGEAEEDILEGMRNWVVQAVQELQKLQPPAPMPGAMPPGMPMQEGAPAEMSAPIAA